MRFSSTLLAGAVCLTTAAALYVSRGVLDRVLTTDGSIRLALLPPWQSLAGFTLMAALALLWLTRRRRSSSSSARRRPGLAVIGLPLFALAALIVPYLPWLPDRLPALQMLAGPSKYVIWLLVLTQVAWVIWQLAPQPLARFQRLSLRSLRSIRTVAILIGVVTFALTGVAAVRLTNGGLFPGGDEPHYLVIAQSLWLDRDLKIENNHTRGDYYEYFGQSLAPHYLTRGGDGEIYSIHPVGLPALLAPVYGLGGYPLIVAFMLAMAATAAALTWRWVVAHTNHVGAATFAWAAIVLSPPFALNSFAIYPEVAAALAVVGALMAMPRADEKADRLWLWLIGGAIAGTLPWLSTKYSPMSAAIIVVGLSRIWLSGTRQEIIDSARTRLLRSAALVAPYVAMLAAWFSFFYVIWGTPRPQAPYGALVQTRPFNLVFGAPGLLFDQEYGLLAYAPVYILAATGLVSMWRSGGETRRRAIEILVVWAALLGTVGAFRIWWGGSAAPARPLVSGLLPLALPIAIAFGAAAEGTARRAAHHVLLWIGAGLSVLLVTANNGLLINNDRDGTSSVLEYLSPLWEVWTLAPTFIHHEAPTAALHAIAWLLIAVAAGWWLSRARSATPGRASLTALLTLVGALVLVEMVMPLLPADPPWPRVDLASRARLASLDEFDRTALPNAVLYDPLRFISAESAESRLVVKAGLGTRTDRQPVRVLHNGRFSLPAGRYRVDLRWNTRDPFPAAATESLGLQIGRFGRPMRVWSLSPVRGGTWQAEFELPVSTGFVGLVGSRELESATAEIVFTPLSIVDRSRRPQAPDVLSAAQYGPVMLLFHDNQAYPEPTGFWTAGETRTSVGVARDDQGTAPVTLRMHSGPEPNRVTFSSPGWSQTIELRPDAVGSVTLPTFSRRVIELEIATERSFVPAQTDASSRDRRRLGAWIEVESPTRVATDKR
jgi:hypothetical protein